MAEDAGDEFHAAQIKLGIRPSPEKIVSLRNQPLTIEHAMRALDMDFKEPEQPESNGSEQREDKIARCVRKRALRDQTEKDRANILAEKRTKREAAKAGAKLGQAVRGAGPPKQTAS